MEEVLFIKSKVDEVIKSMTGYMVLKDLQPWEEVILNDLQTELDNYSKVLGSLMVFHNIKIKELSAA